ncbi:MAG: formylglycine-generating enzyme family protein [Deltaproteobacteria bacterium]|jgi:formylglycine-generating enzyme required for sulfatase activity|nr:formylglycine-generating enzyme family protein [Deltaproteobacteria bacterium]
MSEPNVFLSRKPVVFKAGFAALAGVLFAAFALALLAGGTFSDPASAQQLGGVVTDNKKASTNPNPDGDDFEIPLPCGLSMAFRFVFIPQSGYIGEITSHFGTASKETNMNGVAMSSDFNGKHPVYLGSSLALENLPNKYKPVAQRIQDSINATYSSEEGKDASIRPFYLIGKYEVTNAQWEAVMNGNCELNNASSFPVANVSWYDVVSFTEKLMTHVLANNPEALPAYPNNSTVVSFLRLPTEEEWEYAARGGHSVNLSDLSLHEFFPFKSGEKATDYGLFDDGVSPPNSSPKRIGSYFPNPLGVHDTIGNVDEMTFSTYKMIIGNRVHGSSGGFLRKGGSFRDTEKNVYSGARREAAFFHRSGPYRSTDLGFRLAISSVTIGTQDRLAKLTDEYRGFNLKISSKDNTARESMEILNDMLKKIDNTVQKEALRNVIDNLEKLNIKSLDRTKTEISLRISGLVDVLLDLRTVKQRQLQNEQLSATVAKQLKAIDDMIANFPNMPEISEEDKNKYHLFKNQKTENQKQVAANNKELRESYSVEKDRYHKLLEGFSHYDRYLVFSELDKMVKGITGDDFNSRQTKFCLDIVKKNLDVVFSTRPVSDIPDSALEDKLPVIPVLVN